MAGNPVAKPIALSRTERGDQCATRRAYCLPTPGSADERATEMIVESLTAVSIMSDAMQALVPRLRRPHRLAAEFREAFWDSGDL
jgi:hypothetical protein